MKKRPKLKAKTNKVQHQPGDYVIIDYDNRHYLMKVLKRRDDGTLTLINEKELPYQTLEQDFASEAVLLNLGPRPKHGTVYGCKVEPYRSTIFVPTWGEVHFFRKNTKDERKTLRTGMKNVLELLKLQGWSNVKDLLPIPVEIHDKKGRWSGNYMYKKGTGDAPDFDRIQLTLEKLENAPYVLAHEFAHAVWYRALTPKQHARWIRLYHRYVTLTNVPDKTISKLGRQFDTSQQSCRQFAKELSEEDRPVFQRCLDYIYDMHSLSATHVDALIEAGDSIRDLWPTGNVALSDVEEKVTEYATTKPEEFWAESFALHLIKTKLPKSIAAELERTMKAVKLSA